MVTAVDQLWVADITYIRLPREFVYLAVVLDAFSRRVIGWALERHLMTELTLNALQMALGNRHRETWLDPSFGSRQAIRCRRLRFFTCQTSDPHQHESHR